MKERIAYFKRFEFATMVYNGHLDCEVFEKLPTYKDHIPTETCYSVELIDGSLYVSKYDHDKKNFIPIVATSNFSIKFN